MLAAKASRRSFLIGGAKLVAGAAIGAGALGTVAGCQGSSAPPAASASTAKTATKQLEAVQWPWPYVELDPKVVAEKGHESYYVAGCAYGTFNAIISALREKVGEPFTHMPTEMLRFGEGGGVGWATLCGALNGSAAAINLVSKDYAKIVNELIGWYTTTAFPTFKPSKPKVEISVTSVSGSPLCHVSVTEWCNASGFKAESPERSERCARLAGQVAAHAVELLNQEASGKFKASFTPAASVNTCAPCHLKGGTIENARGKMDCVQCHTPHQ